MIKTLIFVVILCVSSITSAEPYYQRLAKTEASLLHLLVNNLNKTYFVGKAIDDKEKPNNGDFEEAFTQFSLTQDNRLLITMHFRAPVTVTTIAKCKEQLTKHLSIHKPAVAALLTIFSTVSFSEEQATEFANTAVGSATIIANENKELSAKCSI